MKNKLPALFLAHGSPMNAIETNGYTEVIKKLAQKIERPEAILVISAHWLTRGTYINIDDKPKTIYDFYGFPEELYNIKYSPKGAKKYAEQAINELKALGVEIEATSSWGLDHGAWTLLRHMYPKEDIPMFQMSINALFSNEEHYELGKKLRGLREKGILIIASGNIVHNLREMDYETDAEPAKLAKEFDEYVAEAIINKNHEKLIDYSEVKKAAKFSLPTDEHFLPLLYIAALQEEGESAEFIYDKIYNRSLSMRAIKIGNK